MGRKIADDCVSIYTTLFNKGCFPRVIYRPFES